MYLAPGKWGVAYEIEIPAIKRAVVDFSVSADWTPASGDSKISIDGGNVANTSNLPAILGGTGAAAWKQTITATEMRATKRVFVQWVDSATKAVEDQAFIIPIEYGVRSNIAQGGGSTSITLDASASSTTDFYVGLVVELLDGTGVGQFRFITAYNGTTKVATVHRAWATNPDNTSIFRLNFSAEADVRTIKGDAQSATDAKDFYDDGYDPSTNKVQGVVLVDTLTTYTGNTPQTGDSFVRIGANGSGLTSLAPASTALSTSQWSNARAGYLDNLNVGGNVASSAEVTSIQNNTRVVRVVPPVIERPDSGTTTYRIELFLYDDIGNMEAPDAAPTIALVNQAGTDRSSRLDSTTMALVETGRYRAIYTADVADSLEQLVWAFSVVEGGATRKYGNQSVIVDTTAVDFTAADRTKLETLATDYTTARAAKLDNLDATVSSRQVSIWANASSTVNLSGTTVGTVTALSAAAIQSIWAALTSALTTVGSIGKLLVDRIDVVLSTRLASSSYTAPDNAGISSAASSAASAASSASTAATNTSTLLTRIPGPLFSGITSLAQWLGALAGKQTANSTARTEIRATGAGSGLYDETTDSLEAIQIAVDAIEGGGGGGGNTVVVISRPGLIPAAEYSTGTIRARRGDTFRQQLTGLGDLSDATAIVFTVKNQTSDADTAAVLQVDQSGLLRINGESPEDSNDGDLTIDDENEGDITIFVDESQMANLGDDSSDEVLSRTVQLPVKTYFYDVQKRTAADVVTLAEGILKISSDINRATT